MGECFNYPPKVMRPLAEKTWILSLNMSWTDWHWDRIDFDPDMSDLKFWIQWARSGGLNSLFKTCLHPSIYGQSFWLELLSTLPITWHICLMGHFNVKFLTKLNFFYAYYLENICDPHKCQIKSYLPNALFNIDVEGSYVHLLKVCKILIFSSGMLFSEKFQSTYN